MHKLFLCLDSIVSHGFVQKVVDQLLMFLLSYVRNKWHAKDPTQI
jgi:hypothetical protein